MNIQDEIIEHQDGALLVMASAGSGKTSVLTKRIRRLLQEVNSKFHILALTFTNKAANEMEERLADVEEIDRRAFIGTFHSFCLDIIQKHGYAIGLGEQPFIFEKNDDRISLLIQVFEKPENWDLKKYYVEKDKKGQMQFINNALSYISLKKKNLKGIEKFDYLDNDIENIKIQKMYNEYNDLLESQKAMDFDDVILKAYQIFSYRPEIAKLYRKQFKYIFIDEAQDLNFSQYELLKLLCNGEHENVMMVGDTKQSLYNFNGSDIKFMQENFMLDFNAEKKELITNYRSAKKIIEVANHVIKGSMTGYDTSVEGKFKLFDNCETEREEAFAVVSEINNYLGSKSYSEGKIIEDISMSDIVVLARSKYLLKYVKEELDSQKILCHFKKGSETISFDSQLMNVFDLGLRVLINPLDKLHFDAILKIYDIELNGTVEYSSGFEKLKTISKQLSDSNLLEYQKLLKSWEILYDSERFNFQSALNILKDEVGESNNSNGEDNVKEKEGELIQSDIAEYEKYWKLYARNTKADLKSLSHFKTQLSLGTIIPIEEENGITLSTIHLSKGLEFKIVFVIGLDDGSLPYYKSKQTGGRALIEEKNIFYVAVTRAKRALYISYPRTRLMPWNPEVPKPQKPSEYLEGLKELETT